MRMTSHGLFDVGWFTSHTVGWEQQPSGGSVPVREPLNPPHARWYCECGAVSGRITGENKVTARARAVRAHARHVEENDVPTVGTERGKQ